MFQTKIFFATLYLTTTQIRLTRSNHTWTDLLPLGGIAESNGENQTVYNTEQMRTQRDAALNGTPPRQHIVTISSGKGLRPDGKPVASPSGPLGRQDSTIHFYDANANGGAGGHSHTWNRDANGGAGGWDSF